MAMPFRNLTEHFSDERKALIEKESDLLLMEYELLSALREDREVTQKELANILEIRQAAISKFEHQDEVMVQMLERSIRALGGELELRAKFADPEEAKGEVCVGVWSEDDPLLPHQQLLSFASIQ